MTDEETVEETPAVDEAREQLLKDLSHNLGDTLIAVSYTHLTLPTKRIV